MLHLESISIGHHIWRNMLAQQQFDTGKAKGRRGCPAVLT
ncbi:hypothetical protein RNAN_0694 [Rheinheimera nanhaiensis E407-8]|uniref:Uncharacterized protein n=1 Tax=Rheinheimera nanhaiensis E407-8 TaxID=562729 RepID=I1DUJ7_9GAMM|nr:hypothetical protein RNAN_0694 [Rheinheimera nanhaiensis E407-8]